MTRRGGESQHAVTEQDRAPIPRELRFPAAFLWGLAVVAATGAGVVCAAQAYLAVLEKVPEGTPSPWIGLLVYLHLVREEGRWRIVNVLWELRPRE